MFVATRSSYCLCTMAITQETKDIILCIVFRSCFVNYMRSVYTIFYLSKTAEYKFNNNRTESEQV